MNRFISKSCIGEKCTICGKSAEHKVEEIIFDDEPYPEYHGIKIGRHPLTSYVCHEHFVMIMGPGAGK